MKMLVICLLFSLMGFSSLQAGDFKLTPAQEETLSYLPANLVRNYMRRLRRTHRIDEEYLRNNPMTASREGAGIVLAHDYGAAFNRMTSFPYIINDTGQSKTLSDRMINNEMQ